MKLPSRTRSLMAGAALLAAGSLAAQSSTTPSNHDFSGISLFRTYCASCHGTSAKGDGPLAEHLRIRPADLTRITIKHEGAFPAERVHRIIDGRVPVKGHGASDMPVWGDAFKNALEGGDDDTIHAKIDALVQHVESIQAKK